jgi:hypothetical protein
MTIAEKYEKVRPLIKTGDIVLFHGSGLLSKLEQYFTSGYYNHCGISFKVLDRLFIIDSQAAGVNPGFLSDRISTYTDFCIVRLLRTDAQILDALNKLMDKASQLPYMKYDFLRLLQIAIWEKTGLDPKFLDQKNRYICSQSVQNFTDSLNINCYNRITLPLIVPNDFVSHLDQREAIIYFNDNLKP